MLEQQRREMQYINVEESKKTFQPDSINQSQSQSRVSHLAPPNEEEANEPSVWDDPDMVPVPVLPVFSDNSISYDAHEGTSQSNVMKAMAHHEYTTPPDESTQRIRNNASSIMNTDGTIAGL